MDRLIIISILTMMGLGVFFGIILSLASQKFKVFQDPKIKKLIEILPGLNCGACGYGSCSAFAETVVEKKEEIENFCLVSNDETSLKICEVLGIEKKEKTKKVAIMHCGAEEGFAKKKALYKGIDSCLLCDGIAGGYLECKFGCLGLGDCEDVCPVEAIKIVNNLARINYRKCIGCGKCVQACPRGMISLEDFNPGGMVVIACNSTNSGKFVREICKVGCIGCKICEKKCPEGIFKVENNLSILNYNKTKGIKNWMNCIEKCPMNTIIFRS